MNCNTVARYLSAYLDGECSRKTSDEVTAHLALCTACSERRHRLDVARLALAHLFDTDQEQTPPLPSNFTGMMSKIAATRTL